MIEQKTHYDSQVIKDEMDKNWLYLTNYSLLIILVSIIVIDYNKDLIWQAKIQTFAIIIDNIEINTSIIR